MKIGLISISKFKEMLIEHCLGDSESTQAAISILEDLGLLDSLNDTEKGDLNLWGQLEK